MSVQPKVSIYVRNVNATEYISYDELSEKEKDNVWRRLNDTAMRAIGYEPVENATRNGTIMDKRKSGNYQRAECQESNGYHCKQVQCEVE